MACVEALTIDPPFYASLVFCTLLSAGLRYYKSLWSLHWHLDKGLAPCKIWCCDPVMSKCICEDGKCKKSWASSGLMMKWKILFFNSSLQWEVFCSAQVVYVHVGAFISLGVLACTWLGEILSTSPFSSALDISVNFRISLEAWVLNQRQS